VQAHPFMDREGRIPPGLIAGLIVFVLTIGALAYYTGRFGRRGPAVSPVENLPAPGAPLPAVAENVPTPVEIPPTVTPSEPMVVKKSSRSTRVLVEKSTPITVPVVPPVMTPRPAAVRPTPTPDDSARRRIVVEIVNTPRPLPSPTVPELEQGNEEEPEEMPEEPEPEPTPGGPGQAGGRRVSI
jgi:hypothetical protein